MHTIKHIPAFYDGCQIVYASQYVEKLCDSLKQIRDEQRKSGEWREGNGFDKVYNYSYKKVMIE